MQALLKGSLKALLVLLVVVFVSSTRPVVPGIPSPPQCCVTNRYNVTLVYRVLVYDRILCL